ncbi:hypothetical protein AB0K43_23485 [Kitasatospora sp. NPDC049258]|uniref:hypothetical protein n=1 Tax=Kitasatospora sp. NPDC049258 TaxID=3155394 RepID=UPI0034196FAB
MSTSESSAEVSARSARTLLRAGLADPQHLPEQLALLAVQLEGHRARAAVAKLRRTKPGAGPVELGRLVIERGTRLTVVEGGAVGGPFMLLVPVAFCAALLAQLRMVLELAALAGHDPVVRERAAELLVVQGAYPTVPQARQALAEVADRPAVPAEGRLPRGTRTRMLREMAYLLGLIDPGGRRPGRIRQAAGRLAVAALVVVGFFFPLVWVPAMWVAYQRGTSRLGLRAAEFYGSRSGGAPVGPPAGGGGWRPAGVLVLARTLVATLVPTFALLVVLVTDVRLVGSKLAAGLVAVALASLVVATVHGIRHWLRRR